MIIIANINANWNKTEGEHIRNLGTLNKQIAGRTQKEYNIENKDKNKEVQKELDAENIKYKEEIAAIVFNACNNWAGWAHFDNLNFKWIKWASREHN